MTKDDDGSYHREYAATAGQQAAFFREQAQRRRQAAEQARTFAEVSLADDDREAQARRAERLETLGRHDETMAEAFEARARRPG
ncbi:hypothetical protein OPKNFCMD_3432 [Methylobacterium crusticola]|uniref:Uncharacterized protein n=1 Tax=Methylobacterium crusticola TaxID=1697972 RepID=A0ABQ4QZT3_9HYPH|nr:hypothetical protein [Methylobacterium crusticola]GJD50687.1 hypothetical protein OPKNFCMD_3432 [Methylobacterium crusticola]